MEALWTWIESFTNLERTGAAFSGRTYQLERMRRLAQRFGSPQSAFRCVHVAGSKGKGSTSALLACSLAASGLRTGLYTSPHVESYRERFTVLEAGLPPDGTPIDRQPGIEELGDRLRREIEGLEPSFLRDYGPPTTFEMLTLLAFLLFRERGCRIAVLETGIGGRLDATNIVIPELCLLTPIEREHTDVLGETLPEIAREKAGILKPGVPAFSSGQVPEVRAVLRETAARLGSPLAFLDEELERLRSRLTRRGTEVRLRFRGEPERRFHLALLGDFQAENAALVELAGRRVLGLDAEALDRGLAAARLPGRLELLRARPPVVVDGAHTPRSVERTLAAFRALFGRHGVLLFGTAKGKKAAEMAAVLAPAFRRIVVTTPGSFKQSEPREVHRLFRALEPAARLEEDTAAALRLALELAGGRCPLLVIGSFYLAGEVRRLLPPAAPRGQRPVA